MSHITNVQVKIRDVAALAAAVAHLGGRFEEGAQTYKTYYGNTKCEHAIRFPQAGYDIGVVKATDGDGYELQYDRWGTHGQAVERVAGAGLSALKREYGVAVATTRAQKLARQGWRVQRQDLDGGRVRLRLTRR